MYKLFFAAILVACLGNSAVFAQQQNGINSEVQLGAVFTTGNTDNENINFRGEVDWRRNAWEYGFLLDAFTATQENVRTADRMYYVADAEYDLNENSFVLTRLAHEVDEFSGYESQSDLSVSYGRNLLTSVENMELTLNAGVGARTSRTEEGDFDEGIIRLAGDYAWEISPSATFGQVLSTEAGDKTSIFRSETSIETTILDNLSLRFSFNIKHQTDVPAGREKTDTKTAITFVMNF